MATTTPRRRKTDGGWRSRFPERVYRDFWLLVVTGLVFWALIGIQNERWNNVYNGCQGANERYANTLRVLDDAIRQAPKAQQARAKTTRAQTLAFIAALAPPHLDRRRRSTCHAFADRQVNRWP